MTGPQPPDSTPAPALREDVLVSVCFGNLPADAASFAAVVKLARKLDARFRFREIGVVISESARDSYTPLLRQVDNLRLLLVRDGTAYYRRRVIAADEAIGDVVLMASAAELAWLDPIAMVEQAADNQRMMVALRPLGSFDRLLGFPLVLLGRAAGFQVGLGDLQTLAMPRLLLGQLLSHPDPDLALRFPPRDARVPLAFAEAAADIPPPPRSGQGMRRLGLLQKLLVFMAPALLMMVTLAATMLALFGLGYALYAIAAWFIVAKLAPGWLTLSEMLSFTAFFLGVSITGLSLGLQRLLAQTEQHRIEELVGEVNRIDLFGQVASELNVQLERDHTDGELPAGP